MTNQEQGVAVGMRQRIVPLWVCVVLVGGVLLTGCGPSDTSGEKSVQRSGAPEVKPVLVETVEVRRGMIEEILERSSALQSEAQVQVLARTRNPAVELLVEEGDRVAKGQVLLRLESDRQRTDYEQARSQLEAARIEFDTQQSLYDQRLISETVYRNAKFAFDQANLRADNAKRELDYTEVRAPIGGTVTARMVKVGDSVDTGTPIFEIIDLDSTVAVIHVPEQYIPKLSTNMEARIVSGTLGGQVFDGYVKRVAPVVQEQAGTVKVVIGARVLGALRPGMWVDVELVLSKTRNAVLIPKRAIVYDNDQTYAYKIHLDTNGTPRAKRQLVVARNMDKAHVEPEGGFESGDRVVVAGQSGLKDDAAVREVQPAEIEATDSLLSEGADTMEAFPGATATSASSGD